MFANFTTLAHFSVSSAIRRAKSAGEPGSAVLPIAASCAFIFGSASARWFRVYYATMSGGVPLGAPKPVMRLVSSPAEIRPWSARPVVSGSASRGHRQRPQFASYDLIDRRGMDENQPAPGR